MNDKQPRPWKYRRTPFEGAMHVSLEPPWSNDTCSTVKYEYSLLLPEIERAAVIILQNPDVQVGQIASEFPEIGKRCSDCLIQHLISEAAPADRRFSARQFCIQVLSAVSGYPVGTITKYLYRKSRQVKQPLPGRPRKK